MSEAKILLTIYSGGGAFKKGKPETKKYQLTKKELFPSQKFKKGEGNKVIKKGTYKIIPLIPIPTTQRITMCKDAYDYFTSSQCPEWYHNIKEWRKMPPKQRLELHLARTCAHFRGNSFTYQIIEEN